MANQKKTTKKVQKKKKRRLNLKVFLFPFSLILIILSIFLALKLIKLDMLPMFLLIAVIVLVMSFILLFCIWILTRKKRITQMICMVLSVVLIIGLAVGNSYIKRTINLFENLDYVGSSKITVSLVSLSSNQKNKVSDYDTIGVQRENENDMVAVEEMIRENNAAMDEMDYTFIQESTKALYDGEVELIALNESYRTNLSEFYPNFDKETSVVCSKTYEIEAQPVSKNPVKDITQDAFTVLISGNDDYGQFQTVARSDVNMLVTVNPKTGVVLFTSIPRDYYVPQVCEEGTGCLMGQYDKLTHTGLHGVDCTKKTIESFMNININYTVRVNFSSVINLVNALGGIDVYVEEGLAIPEFYTDSSYSSHEGWNHYDGWGALAFARERYGYEDGDFQRVRNQQTVIMAILDKLLSPSILMNYGKFIDALGGAFETSMTAEEMSRLVKYQLTANPKWTFEKQSLNSEGGYGYSAEMGTDAYVMYPYEESIQEGHNKIESVINGEVSEEVES